MRNQQRYNINERIEFDLFSSPASPPPPFLSPLSTTISSVRRMLGTASSACSMPRNPLGRCAAMGFAISRTRAKTRMLNRRGAMVECWLNCIRREMCKWSQRINCVLLMLKTKHENFTSFFSGFGGVIGILSLANTMQDWWYSLCMWHLRCLV